MLHNSEDIGQKQFLRAFLESADKNESEKLRDRIKIRKPKDTGRSNIDDLLAFFKIAPNGAVCLHQ
jgi:hypothetical protein